MSKGDLPPDSGVDNRGRALGHGGFRACGAACTLATPRLVSRKVASDLPTYQLGVARAQAAPHAREPPRPTAQPLSSTREVGQFPLATPQPAMPPGRRAWSTSVPLPASATTGHRVAAYPPRRTFSNLAATPMTSIRAPGYTFTVLDPADSDVRGSAYLPLGLEEGTSRCGLACGRTDRTSTCRWPTPVGWLATDCSGSGCTAAVMESSRHAHAAIRLRLSSAHNCQAPSRRASEALARARPGSPTLGAKFTYEAGLVLLST